MEFIKTLITGENAFILGMSLILIGVIFYFMPRVLKGHYEMCNQLRQAMKQEALQLGQEERYKRLTAEEKGISKIPMYSKIMMATGVVMIVATLICQIGK